MTKFRDLPIGETFDFVSPDRMMNSFYKRCTKISARRYRDDTATVHRVGSINAAVYHIGSEHDAAMVEMAAIFAAQDAVDAAKPKRPDMLLWLDDHRGVYIPRDFANCFVDRAKHVANVSDEDWTVLESGPDHESYWDVWTDVCDSAVVTDTNGVKFSLHQDGALWLVPHGMEWNEETETFDWPDERATDEDEPERDSMGARLDGLADPDA